MLEWMQDDLITLKDENIRFLERHEKEIVKRIRQFDKGAEENLEGEILFQLLTHIMDICNIIEYMQKPVQKEGILRRDQEGNLSLNGQQLPTMMQLEAYVYDEEQRRYLWTWTWVGTGKFPVLEGVKENPVGIRVRIR